MRESNNFAAEERKVNEGILLGVVNKRSNSQRRSVEYGGFFRSDVRHVFRERILMNRIRLEHNPVHVIIFTLSHFFFMVRESLIKNGVSQF